jgi:aminoglycoside phosphotransferase (APT) family kinase protein
VPGVDLDVLRNWLDEQGVGAGPLLDLDVLSGGTQNVLLAFTRAERRYVLRRPPLHKPPRADETMRREARVLGALAGTGVPHPELVAVCADTAPLGAAFHVCAHVIGFSPWEGLPEPHRSDLGLQHATGLAVADAFARLARVDLDSTGLSDLGRSQGWLERQVQRWAHQLHGYAELDGQGEDRLPGADVVRAWLEAEQPSTCTVGLVHGDAHLGNVLVRPGGSSVAALVDWELATVGDPLLDLGQLLATWPVQGSVYGERVDAPGLPSTDELVERWAAGSGRSVQALPWFHVLACYRLAVLLEGTWARARAGLAPRVTGELLHARALGLVQQARSAVGA